MALSLRGLSKQERDEGKGACPCFIHPAAGSCWKFSALAPHRSRLCQPSAIPSPPHHGILLLRAPAKLALKTIVHVHLKKRCCCNIDLAALSSECYISVLLAGGGKPLLPRRMEELRSSPAVVVAAPLGQANKDTRDGWKGRLFPRQFSPGFWVFQMAWLSGDAS